MCELTYIIYHVNQPCLVLEIWEYIQHIEADM